MAVSAHSTSSSIRKLIITRLRSAHVSAITVSPGHRRLGLASNMMDLLERVGERDSTYLYDLSFYMTLYMMAS
jgi:ribosomal protein S18 acetylase RimI-like enzyme